MLAFRLIFYVITIMPVSSQFAEFSEIHTRIIDYREESYAESFALSPRTSRSLHLLRRNVVTLNNFIEMCELCVFDSESLLFEFEPFEFRRIQIRSLEMNLLRDDSCSAKKFGRTRIQLPGET